MRTLENVLIQIVALAIMPLDLIISLFQKKHV